MEPTGYVRDHGDIVLDAFDHGIRDFGNAMPLCLSTEIEGHDIETYKRRNMRIALYDIIARMPGGFWTGSLGQTWRDKPPRAGSVSMRATRFRLRAGCLTWNEKGDSDAKNAAMMMLMPPNVRKFCETNNSTNLFRDLSKPEQTRCETATGNRPGKASKANRAKKQAEIQEDSTDQEDDADMGEGEVEEDGYGDAARPTTRLAGEPTSRKGLSRSHTDAKKETQQDDSGSVSKHLQAVKGRKRSRYETSSSDEDVEEGPRKLRRTSQWQDLEESSSEYEPAFIHRPTIQPTTRRARTHFQSSRADAESALEFGEAIADSLKVPQSTSNFEDTDGLEYLYDTGVDPQPWSSEDLARGNTFDGDVDKKGVILNVRPGTPLPRRHSKSDSVASDQLDDQVLQSNTISGEERQSVEADEAVYVDAAPRKMPKTAKRSAARKEPKNTRLADNMRSATQFSCSLEAVDTATADRRKLKQAIRRDAQRTTPYANYEQLSLPGASPFADDSQAPPFLGFGGDLPYTNLAHILPPAPFATFSNAAQITQGFDLNDVGSYPNFPQLPLSATPANTYPFSDGLDPHTITFAANAPQPIEHGRSSDFIEASILGAESISSPSSSGISSEVGFEPTCEEFQSEVATGIKSGDYRYVSPVKPDEIKIVDRVLELSRADYYQKTGHRVPENVVSGYGGENYASQQRRLDAHFENEQMEAGNYDGDSIYCLPEWFGGFNDLAWRTALDEEGMRLEDVTQDYDF